MVLIRKESGKSSDLHARRKLGKTAEAGVSEGQRIGVEKCCLPSYINAITSENNTTAIPAREVVSNLTQLIVNIKGKQNFRE